MPRHSFQFEGPEKRLTAQIAVFVDGQNALHGSFYRTSTATGDYETYIVHDLVLSIGPYRLRRPDAGVERPKNDKKLAVWKNTF